jgi:hypothetical protein
MNNKTVQQVKKYWRTQKLKIEREERVAAAKAKAKEQKAAALAAAKKGVSDLEEIS